MVVKIRCFPATYLEALSTQISSNSYWKKNKQKKKQTNKTKQKKNKQKNKQTKKKQLKYLTFLNSVIYLNVSTTV